MLVEVSYIGHTLNSEGVNPDPEKVKAINEMPPPTDKKGIERALGTINYLAKFIPNLLKSKRGNNSDVIFHWEEPQQNAFNSNRNILPEQPVLA